MTPQGIRQREKRRRGAREAAAGPRSRAAHVGGKHRRGPDAPRRFSGHSSPCARLLRGRMKGPRSSPFEGALSHPGGQLETMCCSLEPLTKARVASVYLSLYFNSSNAFLTGKKNAEHFNVKLNSFGQSYTYSINTNIFQGKLEGFLPVRFTPSPPCFSLVLAHIQVV